jgi:hypothetical protein
MKYESLLWKIVTIVAWIALGLFSIFGFLATYEPGTHWKWKVIYTALIAVSLYGLYPRKPRDS